MCGIVAYIGKKEAYPIVLKGLKRLEYRGYDSCALEPHRGEARRAPAEGAQQDGAG